MSALAEVLLGAPPHFVLIGATSMTTAVAWLGVAAARLQLPSAPEPQARG